jgi:hypothetical protein
VVRNDARVVLVAGPQFGATTTDEFSGTHGNLADVVIVSNQEPSQLFAFFVARGARGGRLPRFLLVRKEDCEEATEQSPSEN